MIQYENVVGHGYGRVNAVRPKELMLRNLSANFFGESFLPAFVRHESDFIYTQNPACPEIWEFISSKNRLATQM